MPDLRDIDEIAQAYFLTRTPDRPEYKRLLIRAQANAILPLLRGVLVVVDKQRSWTERLSKTGKESLIGEEDTRLIWAKTVLEPILQDAYDVVQRIGQPALLELCKILFQPDERIRFTAALLLAMHKSPDSDIRDTVYQSFVHIPRNRENALLILILGVVMLHAGDAKWQKFIGGYAQNEGYDVEKWIERTMNSGLIALHQAG